MPGMEPRRADSPLQGAPTFPEALRLRVPRRATPAWGPRAQLLRRAPAASALRGPRVAGAARVYACLRLRARF